MTMSKENCYSQNDIFIILFSCCNNGRFKTFMYIKKEKNKIAKYKKKPSQLE